MSDSLPQIDVESTNSVVVTERFRSLLSMAMVSNNYSQRKLCEALGITMGTIQKYFRGKICPFQVRGIVIQRLATALGVSIDSVYEYLTNGEFKSSITLEDVVSYIKAHGKDELPQILAACTEASAPQVAGTSSSIHPSEQMPEAKSFNDSEATRFAGIITELFTTFVERRGGSSMSAWTILHKQLESINCNEKEVECLHDLAFGMLDLDGAKMTNCINHFHGRYEKVCPMVQVLYDQEELSDCRPKMDQAIAIVS